MSTLSHSENKNQSKNRWIAVVVLLIALVAVAAYAVPRLLYRATPAVTVNPDVSTIGGNIDKWEALGADHYAYTLQLSCFCIDEVRQPVRFVVRNGQVESMTVIATGEAANAEWFDRYATAGNLFGLLQEAEAQDAARIDATYDETTGLPTVVYIDYDELMADEELAFSVSDIELLP